MSAPSWPRLATAAAEPPCRTLRGRWRRVDGDGERTGSVLWQAPGTVQVLDEQGVHDPYETLGGLPRFTVDTDADRHRPVGAAVAVEHDGRPAWRVELLPPGHERGLLQVVVDDATGLCVCLHDVAYGDVVELSALELDVPVTDDDLAPLRAQQAAQGRAQSLHDLVRTRPVPTPRWFPRRRTWQEGPGLLGVDGGDRQGSVGRSAPGVPAPVLPWWDGPVQRLAAHGWEWAVATAEPVTEADARRVVDELELLD